MMSHSALTGDIVGATESLVEFGQRMARDRLVVGSAGNISMRFGETILMTPSGINYEDVDAASITVLDAYGSRLEGTGRRSSEWPMHQQVYRLTDASAIVHTHSPFATAVSTVCDEIPAVHYSVLRLGGPNVRVAPYTTFGSDDLAQLAADALADRTGALLQNHGAIVYGATLAEAYDRALLLEWLAEVYWRGLQIGTPRILDAAELAAVREASRRHRYQDEGS